MVKEIILDNEYVTVWYYNSTKIIHHQFHKYAEGQQFQNALNAGADALEKNGAKKWLSDNRKLPVVNQGDAEWTSTVWRPRIIKAGWKYWAIVPSEKNVGKMLIHKIIKICADLGVTAQEFADPDEALKWLEAQ